MPATSSDNSMAQHRSLPEFRVEHCSTLFDLYSSDCQMDQTSAVYYDTIAIYGKVSVQYGMPSKETRSLDPLQLRLGGGVLWNVPKRRTAISVVKKKALGVGACLTLQTQPKNDGK